MRQIVDKHFYDNWVIPFYLGYTVDLTNEWHPYNVYFLFFYMYFMCFFYFYW
jgi:hypothetical protein